MRNVIERLIGVVKKRFPLIASFHQHQYSYTFQITLVRCAFILHNFIGSRHTEDDIFDEWNIEDAEENDNINDVNPGNYQDENNARTWRDAIAQSMWNSYVIELQNRGILVGGNFDENEFQAELNL